MLALKAPTLDIRPFVYSASAKDPAALVCPDWVQGRPDETSKLRAFLKKVDVLTFESELVAASLVKKALPKGHLLHIAPSLEVLGELQDRLSQKEMLKSCRLETADFVCPVFSRNKKRNKKILARLWERFGPFVLKSRQGGYDGYGTFSFQTEKQLGDFTAFDGSYIAEAFIPFRRELAILAVRSGRELIFTPLVETHQEQSRCLWVRGPAKHPKLSYLKRKIASFLKALSYQGVIAFELFDIKDRLLVNELAPRVHNSGHYSLNALSEDQFTLHLKAVFDFPLPKLQAFKGFAMLNLLGGMKKNRFESFKEFHFHWYGKTEERRGRKMGHVNALANTPAAALRKLLSLMK